MHRRHKVLIWPKTSSPFPPGTLVYLQIVTDQCTVATRYLSSQRPVHHSHKVQYFGLSIDGQGPVHGRDTLLIRPKTSSPFPPGTLVYLEMVTDQCTVATRYLSGQRPVHHSHQVLWYIYRSSGTSAPSPQGTYLAKDQCTVSTRYFGLSSL